MVFQLRSATVICTWLGALLVILMIVEMTIVDIRGAVYLGAASNYDSARKKRGSELRAQCQTYSISKLKLSAQFEKYSIVGHLFFSRRICLAYHWEGEKYMSTVWNISSTICWRISKNGHCLKAIFVHLIHFLGDTSVPLVIPKCGCDTMPNYLVTSNIRLSRYP